MASAGKNDPREGQCEYGTMKGAITNTNHWAKIGQGDVKGISIVEEPQSKNGDKCKQSGQGPTDGHKILQKINANCENILTLSKYF